MFRVNVYWRLVKRELILGIFCTGYTEVGISEHKNGVIEAREEGGLDSKLLPAPSSDTALAAAEASGKRRNDDTSVQSAKERYLARKKQHAS
jgi:hypothetical protein